MFLAFVERGWTAWGQCDGDCRPALPALELKAVAIATTDNVRQPDFT
jgi:hypothetical protein